MPPLPLRSQGLAGKADQNTHTENYKTCSLVPGWAMSRELRGAYGKALGAPNTIGKRIRRVRQAWKWSQIQLAEAIHANQKTLSRWELDRQEPSEPALGALSGLFGLSIEALKTGRGFNIPAPPRRVGNLLVAEAYAVDLIRLPDVGVEGIALLSRDDDSSQSITARKATEAIRKAREEGRPVWVVVG